jgi:hypothetical protein
MLTLLTLLTIVDLSKLLTLLTLLTVLELLNRLTRLTRLNRLTQLTLLIAPNVHQPQALRILTLPRQQRRVRIVAADSILSGQYISLSTSSVIFFEALYFFSVIPRSHGSVHS